MVETTRSNTELRKEVDLLKESCDRTEKTIEALKSMMETMLANQNLNHNNGGAGNSGEIGGDSYMAKGAFNSNFGYQIPTKVSRVEFPHFNGEDLRGWLYKCEQFFEVDETPSAAKVKLASVHLEGKALQWHQMYMKGRLTREIPNWEKYVRALNDRFGALIYDDPMSELVNLKQLGTIQQYLDRFDEIVNCLDLPDYYALSCFLGGLKSEISVNVRMFRPKPLQEAISLSKLQEQAILLSHKKNPLPFNKPNSIPPKYPYTQPNVKPHNNPILPKPTNLPHNFSKPHSGNQRRGYGNLAKPLTDLLKKDAFKWNETSHAAFVELKSAMTSAPVLAMPDFDEDFIIETDASGRGIGAVLLQKGKPIAFMSKALSQRNLALSVYDKEMMAIVVAVQRKVHGKVGSLLHISSVHSDLLKQLKDSWLIDAKCQKIIADLVQNNGRRPRYLNMIIFGDCREKRRRALKTPIGTEKGPLHLLDAFRLLVIFDCIELEKTGAVKGPSTDLETGTGPATIQSSCTSRVLFSMRSTTKEENEVDDEKKYYHSFRSVTYLKKNGIYFGPSSTQSLMDVKFISNFLYAQLQLLVWFVSIYTKVFFLNTIAFEFSPNNLTRCEVTAYMHFMKSLIERPEDVKELREKRILINQLGSDEEVLNVYKEINTYGGANREIFLEVKEKIQKHYNSKRKTWIAELIHTYFRSLWTVLTFLAAFTLLSLSCIQTYYTMHPKSDK
ncbi:hypothetical protein BUALT_Bualt19G0045300 [Buddleja alternifolia]|uniref:Reverse transcriptase/retrotransposon-derived protein RNase H-like domain-containing protein n=1 Tax=Buddleja alternifolia TaxID=168488 RepID=A0AAV6W5A1_9LAMI|nr:hypothetical protein BUALT_Bualt19G0045300 [Buddleja alternifolia]